MSSQNTEKNRALHIYYMVAALVFFLLASVGCYWEITHYSTKKSTGPLSVSIAHSDMAYIDLPRMTAETSGSTMHVQIDMTLEVPRKDVATLEGYMPQIMDRLNNYFPTVHFEEMDSEGSMTLLHKDMLWQINSLGMPVLVHDLIFREFLVM